MSRIVILLICAVYALAQDKLPPQPPITIKPLPTNATTISPTTLPPSNVTTTTPSKPTTTTTLKPTSTTTTTAKPTTTATTTTTTTTSKPTSPTPTPKPKPVEPAINTFTGNYSDTNGICMMMTVAVQIELLDNSTTKINVTNQVNSTVTCGKNYSVETLKILWNDGTLQFTFLKNNSKYDVESIVANVTLPGGNTITLYHIKTQFSVSTTQSYKCAKDQPLNLTEANSNVTVAKLHISHLQYQAFMNTTKSQYDSAWYCDATNTPDIVPVVVGCILAALVVLVLVAYLFGRKRWQARGYLSM